MANQSTHQPHESSRGHVSGSAKYVDDRTPLNGEVYVDVAYSTVARANIKSLDISAALELPGVLAVYTAKDLKQNIWGTIIHDQPFIAQDQVQFAGEVVAVIAAKSTNIARQAKRLVKVEYESLDPVLDVKTAIAREMFIGPKREISSGDVSKQLESSKHRLNGELELQGQDHFYLESHACIAYPGEAGHIEIHASSQHPTEVQHLVAEALGLQQNQVTCIVKRMGGAFGGKESQAAPFAVYAALVASKLGRPARLILTKDDDMKITGKRNPFLIKYEVGYDDEGKIQALDAQMYSDGGAYADLSTSIMERAMLHLDNAYYIPNFRVTGQVCKTNIHPSTAFRGFGGPKGVATIESILEKIAIKLGIDSLAVRQANAYREGQSTPYGQKIEHDILPKLFEQIRETSRYDQRRKKIDAHNQANTSTLRGLSSSAIKFGISFTTRFLNQGAAYVNVLLDGTVQVATGATEMGQGVNTKIAQAVADELSIPFDHVFVVPTSTAKIPNTSPTAASSGSDINGQAALNAVVKVKDRLACVAKAVFARDPKHRGRKVAGAGIAEELDISHLDANGITFADGFVSDTSNNKIKFRELVEEAYLNRISLRDNGYFRYEGIHFNKETGKGRPFFYFTNGVAISEVSVDRYTGEVKILRSDLLMDLGLPVNTNIDMGQVHGGFVQGMGWVTTENLYYQDGDLKSYSPSTYKIPSVHDIPREFNCALYPNPGNKKNFKGSKAVGEPPLMLAMSVWTAIHNALFQENPGNLPIPATQEQVFWQLQKGDKRGYNNE